MYKSKARIQKARNRKGGFRRRCDQRVDCVKERSRSAVKRTHVRGVDTTCVNHHSATEKEAEMIRFFALSHTDLRRLAVHLIIQVLSQECLQHRDGTMIAECVAISKKNS